MMKKVKIFSVMALTAMVAANVGCDDSPVKPFKERSTEICDYTVEKSGKVKAYIDASGSMRGYFSLGSDGRFIGAISNAHADEEVWMDERLTPIRHPLNTDVLNASYKGKDSRFDLMIRRIAADLQADSIQALGLFFTDGIISSAPAETDKDPEHTRKSKNELRNAIIKELNNDSLSVAILNLSARFDGTYTNYKNEKIFKLKVEDRPFYVIAIGKAPQVRHFMKHNELNSNLSDAFGLYGTLNRDTTANYLLSIDQKKWEFKLTLPEYVNDLGEEYIRKNLRVELNGNAVDSFVTIRKNDRQLTLTLTTYGKSHMDAPTIRTKGNELRLSIIKSDAPDFDSLNCYDDCDIATNTNKQEQTFYLATLIEGLKRGAREDSEVPIFRASIKFDKQK